MISLAELEGYLVRYSKPIARMWMAYFKEESSVEKQFMKMRIIYKLLPELAKFNVSGESGRISIIYSQSISSLFMME